ncbi:3-deoxy-manno-octulosonate-8-phosphatase KdsC [Neptunicella sp. SCSIO 80796]|uniref:3-deoxy-manno-octulosonate-8-phosphatase KdsC n=1 Tax=Neptunicella plasticusilytica TaxID=3117012 RepID=UPI003A4D400A
MSVVKTLYGEIDSRLITKLAKIKLLACDVDGVFSDGRIYLGNDGEELKAFHTRDGYGIKAIQKLGIQVAVITGRSSNIVERRMQNLGVAHIIQGEEDKGPALQALTNKLKLAPSQIAAMGDDMPDIGMFELAGIRLSVADGHPYVRQQADYVTCLHGGFGAVREICDLILHAHKKQNQVHGSST